MNRLPFPIGPLWSDMPCRTESGRKSFSIRQGMSIPLIFYQEDMVDLMVELYLVMHDQCRLYYSGNEYMFVY